MTSPIRSDVLRKIIAENVDKGCTLDQIMSVSGHNTLAMVKKYAGQVWQEAHAKEARKKRDGG